MYTFYADGQLFYDPDISNEGYSVLDPKLVFELNKSGSLEFTMPPDNVLYDKIQRLKSVIVVKKENEEIWRGRVLHDEKDFMNRKQVYCEGILSYLLDSVVRPYDWKGSLDGLFRQYITRHNAEVDEAKQFNIGTCDVKDSNNYVHYSSTVYPTTLSEITEKLINTHGGYLKPRVSGDRLYIDYMVSPGTLSDQEIVFGDNLLDLTEYVDSTNVFTVIVPIGQRPESTEEGKENPPITIASVNGGKDYLENTAAINMFGRIEKMQQWDDVTVPANLKTKAQAALNEGIQAAVTLSITAVDLSTLGVDVSRIKCGDYYRVISLPHGVDTNMLCSKAEIDIQNPANNTYTLGSEFTAFTQQQIDAQKNSNQMYRGIYEVNDKVSNLSNDLASNYVSRSEAAQYQTKADTEKNYVGKKELEKLTKEELTKFKVKSGTATYTVKFDEDTLVLTADSSGDSKDTGTGTGKDTGSDTGKDTSTKDTGSDTGKDTNTSTDTGKDTGTSKDGGSK